MIHKPNIIVLILDTLRARNVSAYGYPLKTTPNLDALAAEGVLFQHAFSAATWTVPSHASMLSGLYISQHRIESIKGDRRFNEGIVTLPQALRTQGYRSAAFSQNMLFSPGNHLDTGFDEFHDVEELLGSHLSTRFVQRLADGAPHPLRLPSRYIRKMLAPRLLLDNMVGWIKASDRQTPFFLFANVLAPHFPWTLPPGFLPRGNGFHPKYLLKSEYLTLKKQWEFNSGKRPVTETHRKVWHQLYDAAIRHVDSEIGRFLDRLRRWDGWKDTVVVVTSDHGEMMGGHGGIVGHMLCLHDNLIHVPLIVRHPGYPQGLKVKGVVQTLDLFSSALEWADVPVGEVHPAQRKRPSLSIAVDNPDDDGGFAFAEEDYTDSYNIPEKLIKVNPAMDPKKYPQQQVAVRSANYKYIWHNDRPAEFYNLAADRDEERNLLNGNGKGGYDRQVLQTHQDALKTWRAELEILPPQTVTDVPEMDAVVLDRLRALGYVE